VWCTCWDGSINVAGAIERVKDSNILRAECFLNKYWVVLLLWGNNTKLACTASGATAAEHDALVASNRLVNRKNNDSIQRLQVTLASAFNESMPAISMALYATETRQHILCLLVCLRPRSLLHGSDWLVAVLVVTGVLTSVPEAVLEYIVRDNIKLLLLFSLDVHWATAALFYRSSVAHCVIESGTAAVLSVQCPVYTLS
jgi:hypothetical protein